MRTKTVWTAAAAVLLAVATSGAAWADAIDGDWCSSKSRRQLNIQGRVIITPAGERVDGRYDRHNFDYLAPTGELEAGRHIWMRLVNETMMLFLVDGETTPEVWNRCAKPIA
ncbi:MAG: hypothetical protein EXQ88_00505 [Alphaproteobacteria bacterium]|nr:hypothetical protein [Alphaproteobacteria bacterium]